MRKLNLRKETLTELSADELSAVAGGEASRVICLTDPCITRPVTGLWCVITLDRCLEG